MTSQALGDSGAPYHAHIYYLPESRAQAEALQARLRGFMADGAKPRVLYVGQLRDGSVGPHPIPQFEIHITRGELPRLLPVFEASGLTTLVHPLTDDDLADHTWLGHWLGQPLALDLTTLDPPGKNQGIARFARSDF